MDNQLKRITAVLCTIFLLSGCHSDIQQTQAKEDTTLQQETQEVSLQLQDEPLITEEFEGTLTFADTGDLQEEQKELINLYMKWSESPHTSQSCKDIGTDPQCLFKIYQRWK